MASLAEIQAITGGTYQGASVAPVAPSAAPSAADPSGWVPPAGSHVALQPVIDVGGHVGAAPGLPGSELAPAPGASAPSPAPASHSPGLLPITSAVVNQLRAAQGKPVTMSGVTFTGQAAQHMADVQRAIADPGWGTPARAAQDAAAAEGKTTGLWANIKAGAEEGVGGAESMLDYLNPGILAGHLLGLPTPGAVAQQHIQALPSVANVIPGTELQGLARAATAGAVQMAGMGPMGEEGLLTEIPKMAAMGAAGGATGQFAADQVPKPYKSMAQLVGNLLGGTAAGVGMAAGEGVLRGAGRVGTGLGDATGLRRPATLVDPETGAPMVHPETGAPVTAPEGVMARAQSNLGAAAGRAPADLAAVVRQSAETSGPLPEGFEPTMGQQTGNLGLLARERTLRNFNRAAFISGDAANTAALHAAGGTLAPGGAAEAVSAHVEALLGTIRAAEEAERAASVADAEAKLAAINGDPRAATLAQYAAELRTQLIDRWRPAKAAASRGMELIDPHGTLGLPSGDVGDMAIALTSPSPSEEARRPVTSAQRAARAVVNPTGTVDLPLGDIQDIATEVLADAAAMRGRMVSFKALDDLAGRVAAVMRKMVVNRELGKESVPYRRMGFLRGAIEDAMSAGAADVAEHEVQAAGIAPPGTPSPDRNGVLARVARAATEANAPNAGTRVYSPSGRSVEVNYELRPASSLITSHDDELRPNPAYPQELQPRTIVTAARRQYINGIVADPHPEELGASANGTVGAPIIGPDGVVESGNGRVIALRRIFQENPEGAERYRAWLRDQGYEPKNQDDILVRSRTTDLSAPDRIAWARENNASPVLSLSAGERAISDAKSLTPEILARWRGGDVGAAANRDFVRSFMQAVPETGEEGAIQTTEGELSLGGEPRIRNALLARAYGDQRLLLALTDRGDESLGAFGNAMMDAAGSMARLRGEIEAGRIFPAANISPSLVEAINTISAAKRARIPLGDYIAQRGMFEGPISKGAEDLLHVMFGEDLRARASRARFAAFLEKYAELSQDAVAGRDLLGQEKTVDDLIEEARHATASAAGRQALPRRTAPREANGLGGDLSGQGAGGTGPAAPGPEVGAGGENGAPGAAQDVEDTSAPKFEPWTSEAQMRRRLGRAGYAAYKELWRRGPVGDALEPGLGPNGFRLTDTAAAGRLFRAGAAGGDAMDALIRAVGSPAAAREVLGDLPAYQFRAAAERNGLIDPRRAEAWIASHREALARVPELAHQFRDVASASQAVGEAAARGLAARASVERSALGHFIGRDPDVGMNRLLTSANPDAAARDLMDRIGDNPEAIAGAKRAAADWVLSRIRTTTEAGTSGQRELSRGALAKILETPARVKAIRTILGPSSFETLQGIGRALDLAARAYTAVAVKGSPATAADLAAMGRGAQPSLLAQAAAGDVIGDIAAHLVGAAHGPWGAFLKFAGAVAGGVRQILGINGVQSVRELETLAVLHPNTIGRALLERPVASPKAPIILSLGKRLAALSVSSFEAYQRQQAATRKGTR